MQTIPKEVIRKLVKSEQFQNTGDILTCLKDMFKQALQEVMEVEMDEMMGYNKHERVGAECPENYRNGYSKKTVKTQIGEVDINIPRDRNGEFEPKIPPKHKRNADGLEEKVLNLYAAGMTTRDIADQIRDLYDVEILSEFVSKSAAESVYPFIFMDAIHYKIRDNHTIISKVAYVVLGATRIF